MQKRLLAGLVGFVIVGVGWYAFSPLLDQKKIDEPIPALFVPESKQGNESLIEESTTIPEKTIISDRVPITDTFAHPASGFVRIVKNSSGSILRYEDFKTINGPDVRVYLATSIDASDFIDLGPIKATEGNIHYSIPVGTDLDRYRYALHWCEDFSVLFNSADLSTVSDI